MFYLTFTADPSLTLQQTLGSMRLVAELPVYLDDALKPDILAATREPEPTRIRATALVDLVKKELRKKYWKVTVPYILFTYRIKRPWYQRDIVVPVTLVKWKPTWRTKGHLTFSMEWDISLPHGQTLDLDQVRDSISGGVSDGWGEGVAQVNRFGPIIAYNDETGKNERASNKKIIEDRLTENENGRYALLLTLTGSKFSVHAS